MNIQNQIIENKNEQLKKLLFRLIVFVAYPAYIVHSCVNQLVDLADVHSVHRPVAGSLALQAGAPLGLVLTNDLSDLLVGDVGVVANDHGGHHLHAHPASGGVGQDDPHIAGVGLEVDLQGSAGHQGIQHFLGELEAVLAPSAALAGEARELNDVGQSDLGGGGTNLHGVDLPGRGSLALQASTPGGGAPSATIFAMASCLIFASMSLMMKNSFP